MITHYRILFNDESINQTLSYKIIIISLIFIALFLSKLPILDMPHFGDSAAYDVPYALWLKNHNFNVFIAGPHFLGTYSPLAYLIFAIFYKIFGTNLWVLHVTAIFFSSLTLYFTYRLGSFLRNKRTGLMATLFLLCSALFFAQSGIAQSEIIFTLFVIMTIYFALKENTFLYLISAICLVFTKEPAILFIVLITLFEIYRNKDKGKIQIFKKIGIYFFPIIIFIFWVIMNKLLNNPMFPKRLQFFELTFFRILNNVTFIFKIMAMNKALFSFIFSTLFILLFFIIQFKRTFHMPNLFFIIIFIFSYLVSFLPLFTILPRYFLLLYPLVFICLAMYLDIIIKKKSVLIGLSIIICLLFITEWYGHRAPMGEIDSACLLESNLEYIDMIRVNRAAAEFIEKNYPDSKIFVAWPQNKELTYPENGYVSKPLDVIYIHGGDPLKADLIFYSEQADAQSMMQKILYDLKPTLLKEFEYNNKRTKIYRINKG